MRNYRAGRPETPTMTAAQRRAADKAAYDVFLAECPEPPAPGPAVPQVGHAHPRGHSSRARGCYSQLARTIAGVSQKMLTQTLRTLERDGLVTRTVTPSVPVTRLSASELTDLGCRCRAWSSSSRTGPRATWARSSPPGIGTTPGRSDG